MTVFNYITFPPHVFRVECLIRQRDTRTHHLRYGTEANQNKLPAVYKETVHTLPSSVTRKCNDVSNEFCASIIMAYDQGHPSLSYIKTTTFSLRDREIHTSGQQSFPRKLPNQYNRCLRRKSLSPLRPSPLRVKRFPLHTPATYSACRYGNNEQVFRPRRFWLLAVAR